ncbi:hypothetical protein ABTX85_36010 [Streptomyces sp. NPDC096097]|uniref:hypothetical protein n=1 Tax=Streptomyces sp. NPDC096097 TaxID=3155546 RepID=UPI003328E7B8
MTLRSSCVRARTGWTHYAIARDPGLEAHLRDLETRAARSEESARLLAECSWLRRQTAVVEPGR